MPETFPVAAARLEALDLDALHGGFGSDLLLADATFYACRLADDREAAIALARRALASGELVASGALGFQFAAFSLVSTGLFDEAIAAYDAALIAAERRGDIAARGADPHVPRAARSCCAATSTRRSPSCARRSSRSRRCGSTRRSRTRSASSPRRCSSAASPAEAEAVLAAAGLLDELPVSAHLFFFQYARGRMRIETRRRRSAASTT